jgi:hypothetical protein
MPSGKTVAQRRTFQRTRGLGDLPGGKGSDGQRPSRDPVVATSADQLLQVEPSQRETVKGQPEQQE